MKIIMLRMTILLMGGENFNPAPFLLADSVFA
ncbi:hypothetical protein CFE_1485 [Carboxydocella thermautotrophica]|uniref:Uncharacterized protein n=1 Tax=Carboxydocella thermautotrophica TaxID=178899 RepID=A0A2R4N0S9_CARTR|nr:hypothetical protein CFE_1485 [Carboxydocella thermautotrophica]AVX31094.1 hypothetical protein CTH_1504 [Carboxydocella thermautotrophica]